MAQSAVLGTQCMTASQLKQKFLCCSGCGNEYDAVKRFARLLPCLHSLCNECTSNLSKDGVVVCPQCEQTHTITDGVSCFPQDNTRLDLMDYVRVKLTPDAILCQNCSNTKKATFRCKNCCDFLCEECNDAHTKVTLTREHEVVQLETLQKKENLDAFLHHQTCTEHKGKDLGYYCSKDTCQRPICWMCAMYLHSRDGGHEILEIPEMSEIRKREMRTQICYVNAVAIEVTQVIEEVDLEINKIKTLGKETENQIDDTFQSLIKLIKTRQEELKKDVIRNVKIKTKALENQLHSLKVHQKFLLEAAEFANQTLMSNNPPAFLQIEKTVMERLQQVQNTLFDKAPREIATIGFTCEGLRQEIETTVVTMAKVWSTNAYQPNTTIIPRQETPLQCESMTFTGILNNCEGEPLSEYVPYLAAYITDPAGNKMEVKVQQDGADQFKTTFVPFVSGKFLLELAILDRKMGQHEFTVHPKKIQQGLRINNSLLDGAKVTSFTLERQRAHRDVTVTPDGKTFINIPRGILAGSSLDRLEKFKGTYGRRPFAAPGKFYYEVNIRCTVKCQLDKNNLLFEIGLARMTEIDKKHLVDGQSHAWSMICSQHTKCNGICLHIARGGKCLFHENLSKNDDDCTMEKTYGFLLDTFGEKLKIFDAGRNIQISEMNDVDYSEDLYPVLSGYNSNQVEVNMTICDAED